MKVPQIAKEMYESRLSVETDEQKEKVLSISKKVYTKMRQSGCFNQDLLDEVGEKIKNRDWFYMSMTFSKPGLKLIVEQINTK